MDPAPIPLLMAVLPKVPMLGKTALWHTLGLSEHSRHWDLRTELTVSILRAFIVDTPPEPLSKVQKLSLKDPGIKGRIWISKVTMAPPAEDSLRQSLFKAIEAVKEPGAATGGYTEPPLLPVTAEWTGYRAGATKDSPELQISEEAKYKAMMREVTSPATILYFHGGAHYLMDPASHRPTTKKLAKLTKGRCLSVRYRLSPQNPFPAALLDALVSYFTLLYPPPNSYHEPVKPEHIVFAGDSAGGNLALALMQTLLQFHRQNLKVIWNGVELEVPLPAGMALCSPWADITHCSPSCETNKIYDYLPARSVHPSGMEFPADELWPHPPPRKNLYAEDALLTHPIVSPLAARDWAGAPPMWIQTGEELLSDEDKYVAQLAARQGVAVRFEEYEAMPHCFPMVLTHLPSARLFFEHWAGFVGDVVAGKGMGTEGVRFNAKTLERTELDVRQLVEFGEREIEGWMRERVRMMSSKQPDTMAKL